MRAIGEQVDAQQAELASLEAEERALTARREALEARHTAAKEELGALLNNLWPVHLQNMAHRDRAMESWDRADREFTWLARLYDVTGEKFQEIIEKERLIQETLAKQRQAAETARARLAAINKDKDRLLAERLRFMREIAKLRKEKLSKETELRVVLAAVEELRFKVRRQAEEAAARDAAEEAAARKAAEEAAARDAAEEAARHAAAEVEEEPAPRSPQAGAKPAATPLPQAVATGNITDLKGRLPWPVEDAAKRLGFKQGANPPHRGMGLATRENAPVRAVAWGQVVHNSTLRGFGTVVILVHGEEYFSLYAYLASSNVAVGEEVEAGEVIGRTGYFPELQSPGLYFELRFHQKAINPETWLAALQ